MAKTFFLLKASFNPWALDFFLFIWRISRALRVKKCVAQLSDKKLVSRNFYISAFQNNQLTPTIDFPNKITRNFVQIDH